MVDKNWAKVDVNTVPHLVAPPPGPKSQEVHARAARYMKGYSSQVRLFPVVFESGKGCTLTDVDGNVYIDFSSGIYVTGLGHCHPKVTEAVAEGRGRADERPRLHHARSRCGCWRRWPRSRWARAMNSPACSSTTRARPRSRPACACAAPRRASSSSSPVHRDFHGKTMGAVEPGAVWMLSQGLRAPGFFLVPRAYCYRCEFRQTDPRLRPVLRDYIRTVIKEETAGRVAGIVLEPIQGWAGSVVPPDGLDPEGCGAICDELRHPADGRRGAHLHGPHRARCSPWSTGTRCRTW